MTVRETQRADLVRQVRGQLLSRFGYLMATERFTLEELACRTERTERELRGRLFGDTPLTLIDVSDLAHAMGVQPVILLEPSDADERALVEEAAAAS
jgi:hypothetical protein